MNKHPRIDVADVLRGLAVMGIIILHCIEHFNCFPDPSIVAGQSRWLDFTDKAVWDGLFFMFGGKAYAIFALLFGFSFYVQDSNQRARGKDFRLRFCWRLLLLFLIGNLNAAFFTAEVLVLYALTGFILPLTCRMKDKWILLLACLLLIQPLPLYYVFRAWADPSFVTPAIPTGKFWAATLAVQTQGTFWETIKVNLWEGQLASLAWAWDNGRVFQTAALFLLGMLIGRRQLFLEKNLHVWGWILAGALIAFFPLYGIDNMLPRFIENRNILLPLALTVSSLHKFAFMLILVSGVLFAYYKTPLRATLSKIIPYGKMSLTCYITQSIFGAMLFYNWGFALFDDLGTTASALVGVIFFLVQFAFCRWWMARHDHGPLEHLWKRATWLR